MKLAEEIEYLKTLISEYGETIDGLQEEITLFRNKENLTKDEQPSCSFKKKEIIMVKNVSYHHFTPKSFLHMTKKGLALCQDVSGVPPFALDAWLYSRKQNAKERGE